MWLRPPAVVVLTLAFACGGDGSAGPDAGIAPLGALCTGTAGEVCEPGRCVVLPVREGSSTDGYCTPICTEGDDSTCSAGYTGPGEPVCLQGTCQFPCESASDCPSGLSCLATGGPVDVCAVAASETE